MVKKYSLDILCIVVIAIIAFLTIQKPVIEQNDRPPAGGKGELSETKKEEAKKGIEREMFTPGPLKGRNIFSPDGSYFTKTGTAMKGPLPEQPFKLIGILQGEEKKAVFRDHTGSIITLTEGKNLIDGSVITRINKTSIELEKRGEKKELRIFEVKSPKPSTRRP